MNEVIFGAFVIFVFFLFVEVFPHAMDLPSGPVSSVKNIDHTGSPHEPPLE